MWCGLYRRLRLRRLGFGVADFGFCYEGNYFSSEVEDVRVSFYESIAFAVVAFKSLITGS
jgi:hypothetical protein